MYKPSRRAVGRRCLPAMLLAGLLLAPAVSHAKGRFGEAAGEFAVAAPVHGQAAPPGSQLIRRMIEVTLRRGTYHELLTSTTTARGVRETVQERFDIDLQRHRLHQVGVDRSVRQPHTLLNQQTFERLSVGYRSGTRNNGGAWSCQLFKPGQVQLVGRNTYLAALGWPRQAVDLGPALWRGVPEWHVRATVFGVGSPGDPTPQQRGDLFIARSDGELLAETWHTATGGSVSETYSRYGAQVRISIPAACRPPVQVVVHD